MTELLAQNRKFILIIVVVLIVFAVIKWALEWFLEDRNIPWINNYKYRVKQYFFSYHEKDFYTNLKKVLYYNYWFKYEVYPKVRLADIFEPVEGEKWEKRLWMRHVDFLIADKDQYFTPKLAIELDWDSHKWSRQHKSDNFKNSVFKDSNLPYVRFNNSISNDYETIQKNIIQYLWAPTKQKDIER